MTFTQITYFEAVCKYKNVTKAAEALYVSRSAVSRSLKELENEWNLVLFKRSRTGVELTEEGEMLRDMFKEFTNAYSSLKKHINDTRHAAKSPRLNIGISPTTGSQFFPELIPLFQKSHPDIDLHIAEVPIFEIYTALSNNDFDFFFCPHLSEEIIKDTSIETKQIGCSEMVLCVSATHELATYDKISFEEASKWKRASLLTHMSVDILNETFVYSLLNDNTDSNVVITTSQQKLIHKAVASGFAVSILPKEFATDWKDVKTISLDPVSIINYYVIWKKNSLQLDACKRFYDFLETIPYLTNP